MNQQLFVGVLFAFVLLLALSGALQRGDNGAATEPISFEPIVLFESEQVDLLQLARQQLEAVLAGEPGIVVDAAAVSVNLRREAACFVTLYKDGILRGCMIDAFYPHESLYRNVRRNAVLAATGDERFSPVTIGELDAIRIEISVLDVPQVLKFEGPDDLLEKLHPGADGVILTTEAALSTYLPHIWEAYPDPAKFLSHLCEKQGAAADCWKRNPLPQIEIYHVLHFKEGESPH